MADGVGEGIRSCFLMWERVQRPRCRGRLWGPLRTLTPATRRRTSPARTVAPKEQKKFIGSVEIPDESPSVRSMLARSKEGAC